MVSDSRLAGFAREIDLWRVWRIGMLKKRRLVHVLREVKRRRCGVGEVRQIKETDAACLVLCRYPNASANGIRSPAEAEGSGFQEEEIGS
jgi:hypothetical protein